MTPYPIRSQSIYAFRKDWLFREIEALCWAIFPLQCLPFHHLSEGVWPGKGRGKNDIPSQLHNFKVGVMFLVFTFARRTEEPNWRLEDGMGYVQVGQ